MAYQSKLFRKPFRPGAQLQVFGSKVPIRHGSRWSPPRMWWRQPCRRNSTTPPAVCHHWADQMWAENSCVRNKMWGFCRGFKRFKRFKQIQIFKYTKNNGGSTILTKHVQTMVPWMKKKLYNRCSSQNRWLFWMFISQISPNMWNHVITTQVAILDLAAKKITRMACPADDHPRENTGLFQTPAGRPYVHYPQLWLVRWMKWKIYFGNDGNQKGLKETQVPFPTRKT